VGCVQGRVDVLFVRAGYLTEQVAGDGGDIIKILAGLGFDELAPDKIAITGFVGVSVAKSFGIHGTGSAVLGVFDNGVHGNASSLVMAVGHR
jgi:hypothetical protein